MSGAGTVAAPTTAVAAALARLMRYYSQETSRAWYLLDLASYLLLVIVLGGLLLFKSPPERGLSLLLAITSGLIAWTLLEYSLHRFLLHGLPPFRDWHWQHHRRPQALLGTPTAISLGLMLGLAFLPACWLAGLWPATGLLFGLALGYLNYSWLHQRLHQHRGAGPGLRRSRQGHARHHRARGSGGQYGVSSEFWDVVFATRLPP